MTTSPQPAPEPDGAPSGSSAADPAVTAVAERYGRGVLQATAFVLIFWTLAADVPTAIAGYAEYRPAGSGAGLIAAYAALSGWALVVQFRGGPDRPLLLICPLLIILVALVASVSPGGTVLDRLSWAFPTVGWCALIALWRRPAVQLLTFYLADWGVGLATLIGHDRTDRTSLSRLLVIGFGVSVLQFTLLIGGRRLVAIATRTAELNQQQERLAARDLVAGAVHEARRRRYEFVRATAERLLDDLAAGRLDLADRQAQRDVRVAIGRLRRLMVETDDVPAPLLHELRSCADQAERHGVEVELVPVIGFLPPLAAPHRRALVEPVIQVLACAATHARVTVVASWGEVVVGAVGDGVLPHIPTPDGAAPDGLASNVEVGWEQDGDRVWAQARWTAASR